MSTLLFCRCSVAILWFGNAAGASPSKLLPPTCGLTVVRVSLVLLQNFALTVARLPTHTKRSS